ncbi:FeoB-associated Cys-rich membrane protein [Lactovum miscens]|uniref:FeoB-associated Cys-rich membrane protein n=1 Tax=Lactovum miscens TaxID=190387 RepID=A0A841C4Z6_9LACT|nr:FeoB-associated Cys-rich membrane protein [Lactovum miscens]MBB5887873.1 hypothetical protein [Lactovum miscens]
MNISSIILLVLIMVALCIAIYKIKASKGACDDCDVSNCPIHLSENTEISENISFHKKN